MGVKRNLEDAGFVENPGKITEDEAALYDRQIRLWGMECQKRLREAKLLVIGLNGVTAEVVKNLTLSGVKSITIIDDTEVTIADSASQFFVSSCKPGVKRAEASVAAIRELNPNVNIYLSTGNIFSKSENFFKDFKAMIVTDRCVDTLIKLNELCREHSIQFYCTDAWGFYGYCFLDLSIFTCEWIQRETNKKGSTSQESTDKVMKKQLKYSPLGPTMLAKVGEGLRKRVNKVFILLHVLNHFREMFNRYPSPESREKDVEELIKLRKIVCEKLEYDESKISDEMMRCVFGQISPVCAVVGGILANEIIKGISGNGLPVCNYFLFDGNESVGVNEAILVD